MHFYLRRRALRPIHGLPLVTEDWGGTMARVLFFALTVLCLGVNSLSAETSPPLGSPGADQPGQLGQSDRQAVFQLYGLPLGARIFLMDTEYTERLSPYISNGALGINTYPIMDDKQRRTVIRVETPAADGRYSSWKSTITYSAGSRTVLNVYNASPLPADNVGHLRVIVTLDTIIYINGKQTLEEGEVRDFSTPPLSDGRPFVAKVKFDFRNKTGRRIIRTKEFQIRPGETVNLYNIEKLSDEIGPEGN